MENKKLHFIINYLTQLIINLIDYYLKNFHFTIYFDY